MTYEDLARAALGRTTAPIETACGFTGGGDQANHPSGGRPTCAAREWMR